jgi:hypothetical protein
MAVEKLQDSHCSGNPLAIRGSTHLPCGFPGLTIQNGKLRLFGERVVEFIRVFSIGNDDVHLTDESL